MAYHTCLLLVWFNVNSCPLPTKFSSVVSFNSSLYPTTTGVSLLAVIIGVITLQDVDWASLLYTTSNIHVFVFSDIVAPLASNFAVKVIASLLVIV